MDNKLNTPATQDAGLTTLLTAAGARRWVRCHDGSGEAFAAYDVGIADGVVAELCLKVHALEAPAHSAVASEPAHMDTEQSREYLVGFMERHFTDKTYHRYILGGGGRNALAGDFAWQMARALRMLTSAALPPASSSVPWSTRPESNTITLNYSFASAILGALFNGPTFNPTAHERIKQDFATVMRGDKVPHAQQTKCEWDQGDPDSTEWHTGCGSHWIFNEGGPEENSMIFCHGCGKPIAITSPKGDAR